MTDKILIDRAVLEQALEALNASMPHNNDMDEDWPSHIAARRALRAALEQPQVEQEPVEYWTVANGWVSEQAEVPAAAWVYPEFWDHCKNVGCGTAYGQHGSGRQPLYTHPQLRQPLTDEQIDALAVDDDLLPLSHLEFARAIERAHGIVGE